MAHQDVRRETDQGTVTAERSAAWIFGIIAVALGGLGLLRGFGIIGPEGVDVPVDAELGGLQAAVQSDFWEGILWMLPALAAGVLAWSMANQRAHHADETRNSMRMMAWVLAAVTVALGVLALLVGFNLFDQNWGPTDGVLWGVASMLFSLLTAASYAAIPSAVADEDYLVAIVEQRVGTRAPGTAGATTTTRPGTEPLR